MTTHSGRRVAVVASTVPVTLNTFHRELLRQLGQAHEVHVVSSPGEDLQALAADLGVAVHPVPMVREISPGPDAIALRSWIRLLRQLRPEVVITATPKASLLGQLAARAAGTPQRLYYVGGLRLEGESGLRRAVLWAAERVTGSSANHVIVNSPSLLREVRRHRLFAPRKLASTTPGSSHGVDAEHFAPRPASQALRDKLGLTKDIPVVGFVGRLTRDKGIDDLVEAVEQLRQRDIRLQLLVIGPQDEADSAAYVDRLRNSGLPVTLVGKVSDVRPYYALMDLHVLPSLREGFPNVVLEASASGLPTVTTTATGCVDSVRDGETGLLVPPRDPAALADAIATLVLDHGRRADMGRAARSWVSADFSPPDVVASLLHPVQLGSPAVLRVLHVINSLEQGGAERIVLDLCIEARAHGVDARILVLTKATSTALSTAAARAGVPVIDLGGRSRFDVRSALRARRWTANADVVHAHLFPAFWAVAALPARDRVLTEHSPTNSRRGSNWIRWAERWIYHRYDGVVAISDGVAGALRSYLPEAGTRVHVIENGIDLQRFRPPTRPGTPGELRVVSVGTLDHRKNLADAIRAIGLASECTLDVVGDGPERQELQNLATKVAPGRVHFLGRLDRVEEALSSADVFLSTSRYEGFGLAAVEAMAMGLPVLAPDVPGLREVVGTAGLIHPSGDVATVAEQLRLLARDTALRHHLSTAAISRASLYDRQTTSSRLLALYRDLVKER